MKVDTTDMNASQIEQVLSEVAKELRVQVRKELKDYCQRVDNFANSREFLLNMAKSRASNWSGGNSASNLAEQVWREEALDWMQDLQHREAEALWAKQRELDAQLAQVAQANIDKDKEIAEERARQGERYAKRQRRTRS